MIYTKESITWGNMRELVKSLDDDGQYIRVEFIQSKAINIEKTDNMDLDNRIYAYLRYVIRNKKLGYQSIIDGLLK